MENEKELLNFSDEEMEDDEFNTGDDMGDDEEEEDFADEE